jgi:hypothetical protein
MFEVYIIVLNKLVTNPFKKFRLGVKLRLGPRIESRGTEYCLKSVAKTRCGNTVNDSI